MDDLLPAVGSIGAKGDVRSGYATDTVGYVPSLDGLRAVSILLVVVSHAGLEWLVPGGLGVGIFFVISGFLITRQIVVEIERTKRLNVWRFYLRRVLRLGPPLMVYLCILVPLSAALGAEITLGYSFAGIFYYANYYRIWFDVGSRNPFSIEWSLAVEEQYYLIFPWIMALLARRLRAALPLGLLAMAVGLLWRTYLAHACVGPDMPWPSCGLPFGPGFFENERINKAFDTRFDSIFAGAVVFLAAHCHRSACQRWLIGPMQFWAGSLTVIMSLMVRDPFYRDTLRYTVQEVAIAVVLLNVVWNAAPIVTWLLGLRPMVYVGRLSYSLYLYHWAVLLIAALLGYGLDSHDPGLLAVYVIASFGLAASSYHFVEVPLLKLRKRFGSTGYRGSA